MPIKPVTVPTDLAAFLKGAHAGDIAQIELLVNALQTLQLKITNSATGVTTTTRVQISGETALLEITI